MFHAILFYVARGDAEIFVVRKGILTRSLAIPRQNAETTLKIYELFIYGNTRVGTLIVATIYLQLIQNRYMFRSFTVIQCSHQHCVQPVASDVEVVGYL